MMMKRVSGHINVRPLGEFDINDLYTLIKDENDKGNKVVALVVNYMKRMGHTERANGEKTELKNISNELKEVAEYFNIPVTTAQQLSRSSASIVDAALQTKEEAAIYEQLREEIRDTECYIYIPANNLN